MGDAEWPPYGSAIGLGRWAWRNRSLIQGRVTLAGGKAHALTLRDFLDAGYALLVEEAVRVGVPLEAALDATNEWVAGGPKKKAEATAGVSQPIQTQRERTEAELVAQNNAAMAWLERQPGMR